jgi:hypothetical protein
MGLHHMGEKRLVAVLDGATIIAIENESSS